MKTNARLVFETLAEALKPPSTLPCWRWCEENIVLDNTGPIPGRYQTRYTPQVRSFLESCRDPRTRRTVALVSAQSAKTQTVINCLLYCVAEDPGPAMWVMASQEHVEEFAKKRLFPAVESCTKTAPLLPVARTKRTKRLIQFDTMNLMLRGSNSRPGLQSDPVRYLFCDERREWRPGAIELVRKRTRTFHNAIEISIGTAGADGDELHRDFLEGSQTHFHFRCLTCKRSQPFRFGRRRTILFDKPRDRGGLTWPTNEETKPRGLWDFEAVRRQTRLECEECGRLYDDSEKMDLLETTHPVSYNPKAPRPLASYHWNALAMPWTDCDWGNVAVEFLKAQQQAKRGNMIPLAEFAQETLGEPWAEAIFFHQETATVLGAAYKLNGTDTRPGQFWPKERTRFLAVDVQLDHFWAVARAFAPDGESRLLWAGRLDTWADVRDRQKALSIEDTRLIVDRRYRTDEADDHCALYGWQGMIGSNKTGFSHYNARLRRKIVLPYSTVTHGKPRQFVIEGKPAVRRPRWFAWANKPIKDQLGRLQAGKGIYWGLPADAPEEYLEQLNGERLREKKMPNGATVYEWIETGRQGCHCRDAEGMILTCAIADGLMPHGLLDLEAPETNATAAA
jgi:hypothetical protein